MAKSGNEEELDTSVPLGSPEDLERITDLDVSGVHTPDDFSDFLNTHRILPSLTAAIKTEGTVWVGQHFLAGGDSDAPFATQWYNHQCTAQVYPYSLPEAEDFNAIEIRGSRRTKSGLFNYEYGIRLSVKADRDELEPAVPPQAWLTPKHESLSEGELLARVLKEATSDLRGAVIMHRRMYVSRESGRLIMHSESAES